MSQIPTDVQGWTRDHIEWFLKFIRRSPNAMRPGERLDAGIDLQTFLLNRQFAVVHPAQERPIDDKDIAFLFERLRRVNEQDEGKPWDDVFDESPAAVKRGEGPVQWRLEPSEGWLHLVFIGGLRAVLLARCCSLLQHWWPYLRRCARCGTLFLPEHGRQIYHDAECASSARASKLAGKLRDYHEEYNNRLIRDRRKGKPYKVPRRRGPRKERKN